MKKVKFMLFVLICMSLLCMSIAFAQPQGGEPGGPPDGFGPPPGHEGGPPDGFGPPPGHEGGPGNDKKEPPALTEAQEKELMSFLQKYMPTSYNRTLEMKSENPDKYKKVLGKKYHMMLKLKELMKDNQELFNLIVNKSELEEKSRELAGKYKKSKDNTEKASIRGELEKVVTQLFDLKLKEDKIKIEKMEKESLKLKETIAEKEKNKEAIIQKHIDDITGKNDYLKW